MFTNSIIGSYFSIVYNIIDYSSDHSIALIRSYLKLYLGLN